MLQKTCDQPNYAHTQMALRMLGDGSSGKRKLSEIGRADFYFLTQEGQRMKHDDSYLWRNGYKYAKQADTRSIVF